MPADVVEPAEPPDDLGTRLQGSLGDGYAVHRQLGAGGFACVYLVLDRRLKRRLAVKVLAPDAISSHAVLERFRREAETVAQLSHPNIVPLHFVGDDDTFVYIVMAAIDGGSLAERLAREGPLPIADAIRIFAEVAAALAHAHKRGVIHRDIKPHNILLDAESGRALLTDFGIARTTDAATLTATGVVMGTPTYLSPEQVTGEPADHRADIYALGIVAYEMLAGRPPFEGSTPTAAMLRRLAGPPDPVVKVRPDVPPALAAVVESCLAADPNQRPQSAAEIVHALGDAGTNTARSLPLHIRKARRPVNRTMRIATLVVLLVAMATAARLLAGRFRPPAVGSPPILDSSLVLVPAGTYPIGTDSGPASSRPVHRVRLDAFGIGLHEVTVAEYSAFAATGQASLPWNPDAVPEGRLPVTGVTWAEAAQFCAWRYPGAGRLPTEMEWEAAARGTAGRRYPWGNTWQPSAANTGSRRRAPAPVGSYPLGHSPDGIMDLIGNAWEWTASPFTTTYDTPPPSASDLYVIRGGAYNSYDAVATAEFRGRARASASRADLASTGLRCAVTITASVPHN